MGIDHVHCYLLPGPGGWTLVDTALGLPVVEERWREALSGVEVARIVITHFHPDHVGAAADVSELTGAPVAQGRLDYDQCVRVWGDEDWAGVLVTWFARHGVPPDVTHELIEQGSYYRPFIRYASGPDLLDAATGWTAGRSSRPPVTPTGR